MTTRGNQEGAGVMHGGEEGVREEKLSLAWKGKQELARRRGGVNRVTW